jgi:hypothetical protein
MHGGKDGHTSILRTLLFFITGRVADPDPQFLGSQIRIRIRNKVKMQEL